MEERGAGERPDGLAVQLRSVRAKMGRGQGRGECVVSVLRGTMLHEERFAPWTSHDFLRWEVRWEVEGRGNTLLSYSLKYLIDR